MKLFVIGCCVPYRRHGERGVTAVHLVTAELLRQLQGLGHELVFQAVFNHLRDTPALSHSEEQALGELAATGIAVLPPLGPAEITERPRGPRSAGRLSRFLRRLRGEVRVEDYYPATRLRGPMAARLKASGAEAVLTIWSPEGIAATYGLRDRPKVAYHGDPDFHPIEVRLRDPSLFPVSAGSRLAGRALQPLRAWRGRLWLDGFRRAHLALMQDVDVIANIMAANAEFYRSQGHPRSLYLRSLWRDEPVAPTLPLPRQGGEEGPARPIKIIGHAGPLGATGGTYGLKCLLVDVLPRLEALMAGAAYELHIFGSGALAPALQRWARHPRVVVHGFVEDYDRELQSSDVFVLLNNAGPYQGAHTRHIVAWSMGLCVVVHANSQRAIPETRHLENALVGATPEEIAQSIRLAATDAALNQRLRLGGRATYEQYFRPRLIAEALSAELERLIGVAAPEEAACSATS